MQPECARGLQEAATPAIAPAGREALCELPPAWQQWFAAAAAQPSKPASPLRSADCAVEQPAKNAAAPSVGKLKDVVRAALQAQVKRCLLLHAPNLQPE